MTSEHHKIPANPRILVTNDDGVDARGIAVLEEVARSLSDDVWTCAPEFEQSGASRKMSFTEPVRVRTAGERRWAVNGTPADACFLGVHDLVPGKRPDLILSGVNRGQNLAEDVTLSGTIAAAFQGMELGIPSIALSQAFAGFMASDEAPFETAAALAPPLLRRLIAQGWPRDVVLNINFPPADPSQVDGVVITQHGRRDQWQTTAEKREDPRGRSYYWLGFKGALSNPPAGDDLHAIYNNQVSITPLRLELTDQATRADLATALADLAPRDKPPA